MSPVSDAEIAEAFVQASRNSPFYAQLKFRDFLVGFLMGRGLTIHDALRHADMIDLPEEVR